MTRNIRLRSASVQLISMGRVCTWGQTRAPEAQARSTASSTWVTACGIVLLWNSGDSVVGML